MGRRSLLCVVVLASLMPGCMQSNVFQGTIKTKSHGLLNSTCEKPLLTQFPFEAPYGPHGDLIVLKITDRHGECRDVLLLVVNKPMRGPIFLTGQPAATNKAWLVDPRGLEMVWSEGWPDAIDRYCYELANSRVAAVRATVLHGVIEFRSPPKPDDYHLRVSLASKGDDVSINGEYVTLTDFHPELIPQVLFWTVYALVGGTAHGHML